MYITCLFWKFNKKGIIWNSNLLFSASFTCPNETPILWPPYAKSWLIGKDLDAGRGWGQEETGTTREWDGWMASPTRWMWVWVNSGNWWWTGRPGVLRFMGSKRVGHDWVTELKWTECVESSMSSHVLLLRFFWLANNFSIAWIYQILFYPLSIWWTFWLFLSFDYYE